MERKVVYEIGSIFLYEHACFLRYELQRQPQEDVLLRHLWNATDEYTADVVATAQVSYNVYVKYQIAACNAGYREWLYG